MTSELPITAYVDRLSKRPGEKVRVHVSVREGGSYRARLVRVLSADPNPQGPGVRYEDLARHLDSTHLGQRHPIQLGSYAVAPAPSLSEAGTYTWTALVRPGLLSQSPRAVLSHEHEGRRVTLQLTQSGVRAGVTASNGEASFQLDCSIHTHRWSRVWVSCDAGKGRILIGAQSLDSAAASSVSVRDVPGLRLPGAGKLLVAAQDLAHPQRHFDGKIEDPCVLDGWWESWPDRLVTLKALGTKVRAGWDLSAKISTQSIMDIGPSGLHGILKNVPTRAVRGARWSGTEMCWKHRPQDYGAIHFHSDDLADCEWPIGFEFVIPNSLRSGAYAFHLSCAQGEDWVPFYVLPPRTGPHARIAFLAPTFTYQVYSGYSAIPQFNAAFRERVRSWGAYPAHVEDYPSYGTSTYNWHPDGSGVAFASRLRPLLLMRPGYITSNDPRGSGLHHYSADAHLLAWLESKNLAFDILTDEDLHEEGAALLAPYAAVLTGSHPEYHTAQTLDALASYINTGGRLAYLGGNGFYWRVGRNEELPAVIEIRRAEGGTRIWAAEPGEYYHASDGAYGGLWRRNGRDPQGLVGVGFSVQGPFDGTHYRRTPESRDARFSWIFAGIDGEIIGDYGLSGGGAAGYELDRADVALGTPHDAVVLARTENIPATFYPAVEEMLIPSITVNGKPPESVLRGDMVYFETASGGAVFSVGSITFCGSLWRNGFEGPVSQLVENVVRKFANSKSETT